MKIEPIKNLDAAVRMPGSKSYTQRALVIAALAEGTSCLRNALLSEDTEYLTEALRSLGAGIAARGDDIIVTGTGGKIENPGKEIHLGNNGTAMRFLTAVAALGRGEYILTGTPRLRERPLRPLADALAGMGVDVETAHGGFPPVRIRAAGLPGGPVVLHDIESSQYVSALLVSAPYARKDLSIELRGRIPSLPYVDMTLETMKAFGADVRVTPPDRYLVKSGRPYRGGKYLVEGDASSASYFYLAAVLCGGRVRVENMNPLTLQGDAGFLDILEKLGFGVAKGDHHVVVTGGRAKEGDFVFDLGNMPDMVPTLAVLAALRPGRTVIQNVAHLRLKESDRLAALARELQRTGIRAAESEDGLIIEGGKPRGAVIETYNDHRIAMSFAVLGLAIPGMRIKDRDCVNKSFPGFWEELEKLKTDN